MAKRKTRTRSRQFAQVQGRIEKWRKTRKKRGRMPEPLWKAAAALARKHGVNPVADALGLDYYSLKRRLTPEEDEAPRPAFVEVALRQPDSSARYTVVIERPDGGRMTIRLEDPDGLVALSQAFWSRRA